MRNTLVIYDNEGWVLSQISGSIPAREPVGIPFLWVEVPSGSRVIRVDVSGEEHVPVFEDIPKSDTQLLKEQVADLNIAMAQILGV